MSLGRSLGQSPVSDAPDEDFPCSMPAICYFRAVRIKQLDDDSGFIKSHGAAGVSCPGERSVVEQHNHAGTQVVPGVVLSATSDKWRVRALRYLLSLSGAC